MDEGTGGRSPKTLADVSHLFFSKVEDEADRPGGKPSREVAERPRRRTRVFVVTGDSGAPGKSTFAVNLAHVLAPHGRVALFDADASVPNARYYLGLPSWHYLSPLTGGEGGAPDVVTEGGVLVRDLSNGAAGDESLLDAIVFAELPDAERSPLDFVVVDTPASAVGRQPWIATRGCEYIVTASRGRLGFEGAFVALRYLSRDSGAAFARLVVNRSPDDEARGFHAKTAAAARRLLSMDVGFLGAIPAEPGIGSEQRERGALVTSRPDAAAALAIRRMGTRLLDT